MAAKGKLERIVNVVLRLVNETGKGLKQAQADLKSLSATTKDADSSSKKAAGTTKELGNAVKEAGAKYKQSTIQFKQAADASKKIASSKVSQAVLKIRKGFDNATQGIRRYVTEAKKVVAENKKLAAESRKTDQEVKGLGDTFRNTAIAATALIASLAVMGFPVVQAAEFQRSMSEVQAISGATGEELGQLTARAKELGRTTEYTSIQTAGAMKYLAMAGLTVEQSLGAVGTVLQVAKAGAMDLGESADIVTNILTGFRLEVSDLGRVSDVLVQTFTHTNSTLGELGFAMKYVAPIAAGLGANFEDLTATMGLLHSAGMKGSMAGTALRGVLSALFNPTAQETELMKELGERIGGAGLQIRNSEGDFIGFASLIGQLEDANMDAAESLRLFGQRAGPAIAGLLGMGGDALKHYVELNEKAAGRAQEIADVMGDNVVGALRKVKSAFEGLSIEIGDHTLPAFQMLLEVVGDSLNTITDFAEAHETLSGILVGVVGTITAIVAAVSAYKIAAIGLAPVFKTLIGTAMAAAGGFTMAVATLLALKAALIAVALFIGGMILSETFREWVFGFELFGRSIEEWCVAIISKFAQFWARTKAGFKEMWLRLKEAAGFDVSAERAKLHQTLREELALHQGIIHEVEREREVSSLAAKLKNLEMDRAKSLQKEINRVAKEYAPLIAVARKEWTGVSEKVKYLRITLDSLVSDASKRSKKLGNVIAQGISEGFADIDTSPLIQTLNDAQQEINRNYELSEEERVEKTREIENDIAEIRIKETRKVLNEALSAWSSH
jgi:TP901 family phage tail tape measure protein